MFLKAENENKNFNLKNKIRKAWKFDFKWVYFGRYALYDAIYTYF